MDLVRKVKALFAASGGKAAKKAALPINLDLSVAKERAKKFGNIRGLLRDDEVEEGMDELPDPEAVLTAHRAIVARINRRSFVIICLLFAIIFLVPILQPIYKYDLMNNDKRTIPLVPLSMPNLTDQAILSWAATSITEIMTFGFGDFDQRILAQRGKFTSEGWESFTKAVRDQQLRSSFKARQLVLTTVPSDAPVIVAKGQEADDDVFHWVVEMPIIMTYTTNNNVAERRRNIIRLTISRVPPRDNVFGVGIKKWEMM